MQCFQVNSRVQLPFIGSMIFSMANFRSIRRGIEQECVPVLLDRGERDRGDPPDRRTPNQRTWRGNGMNTWPCARGSSLSMPIIGACSLTTWALSSVCSSISGSEDMQLLRWTMMRRLLQPGKPIWRGFAKKGQRLSKPEKSKGRVITPIRKSRGGFGTWGKHLVSRSGLPPTIRTGRMAAAAWAMAA